MTVFTVDPRQKKIVDINGRPIGLPINDFGSRTEIEFTGFTYSSSLSIALYLINPDFRDGQTMPVYYGTAWTESNGVYKHEMKYGKDYYNSVTQNDSLARLVLVADSVVVLDQEVQIDMIHSYSEDAERLPVGPDGYATEAYVNAAVSGKADKSELEDYQEKITAQNKLDYALVSGTPTIPLSTSQLVNDSTFATSAYVQQETQRMYPLQCSYTTYSGDNLDIAIGNDNFYTNDLNYEIGDNFSLTLYNNSCFAFKTASNFSTYDISFYDEIYYVNKPFDLQAGKCYIISYLNGVMVWSELEVSPY